MKPLGTILTSTALSKEYDKHFAAVLGDRLEKQPTKGKERKKYKIVKPLPAKTEYNRLRNARFTVDVSSLIEDAYSIIEELAGEMEEAADNTPESLQESEIGQRRRQAADDLGALDRPSSIPDECSEITGVYLPNDGDSGSRPARASAAGDRLTTAATILQEHIDNYEKPEDAPADYEEPDFSDLETLIGELEDTSGSLDDVDFPGMYG